MSQELLWQLIAPYVPFACAFLGAFFLARGLNSYHREMRAVENKKYKRSLEALRVDHCVAVREALAFVRDQHQEDLAIMSARHAREVKEMGRKAVESTIAAHSQGDALGFERGRIATLALITRTVKRHHLTVVAGNENLTATLQRN